MQTVDSYTVPVAAKVFITPGRPVTTYHVDLSVGASDAKSQIMKQVEHPWIVLVNITRPVIAQVMADPCQGVGIILCCSSTETGFSTQAAPTGCASFTLTAGSDWTSSIVFSGDMTFAVLRPYWNVPHWNVPRGILQRSVIPAIKRNRNYIKTNNFEVTTHDGKVVTSGEISDEGCLRVHRLPHDNAHVKGDFVALIDGAQLEVRNIDHDGWI